jgi:hypothetical protein
MPAVLKVQIGVIDLPTQQLVHQTSQLDLAEPGGFEQRFARLLDQVCPCVHGLPRSSLSGWRPLWGLWGLQPMSIGGTVERLSALCRACNKLYLRFPNRRSAYFLLLVQEKVRKEKTPRSRRRSLKPSERCPALLANTAREPNSPAGEEHARSGSTPSRETPRCWLRCSACSTGVEQQQQLQPLDFAMRDFNLCAHLKRALRCL